MKGREDDCRSFSKEEIFSALDSLLERGPSNLNGITLEMPAAFHISHERAWEMFIEWAETAIRRYIKVVDSKGNVLFKLNGAKDGGGRKRGTG